MSEEVETNQIPAEGEEEPAVDLQIASGEAVRILRVTCMLLMTFGRLSVACRVVG